MEAIERIEAGGRYSWTLEWSNSNAKSESGQIGRVGNCGQIRAACTCEAKSKTKPSKAKAVLASDWSGGRPPKIIRPNPASAAQTLLRTSVPESSARCPPGWLFSKMHTKDSAAPPRPPGAAEVRAWLDLTLLGSTIAGADHGPAVGPCPSA